MAHRDVDRFNRWADTYDQHWMQRRIFEPVQQTVLGLAAEQVPHPAAILDVGCGTGRLLVGAERQFPGAALVGVDAAAEMVKHAAAASHTIHFEQATAEALPFPGGRFDLVFSTMTFHHWHDQSRGAAEVARVMKPEGRWLLADFIATGWIGFLRTLFRQNQFPKRARLDEMLHQAGLSVVGERRVPGLGGQVSVLSIGPVAGRIAG